VSKNFCVCETVRSQISIFFLSLSSSRDVNRPSSSSSKRPGQSEEDLAWRRIQILCITTYRTICAVVHTPSALQAAILALVGSSRVQSANISIPLPLTRVNGDSWRKLGVQNREIKRGTWPVN
jgi:hypothetical protein